MPAQTTTAGAEDLPDISIGLLQSVREILILYRGGNTQAEVARLTSQSETAVSKKIATVEKRVGFPLTQRDPDNRRRLTPRAEQFLADTERLLQSYDALLSPTGCTTWRVRVAAPPSVITSFLAPVFGRLTSGDTSSVAASRFQANCPRVMVEAFHLSDPGAVAREVERGAIDCGIIEGERPPQTDRFAAFELFEGAPKGFSFRPEAFGTSQPSLAELLEQPLVLHRDHADLLDFLPPAKSGREVRFLVDTFNAIRAAVVSGAGVGVGPPLAPGGKTLGHIPFNDIAVEDDARLEYVLARLRKQTVSPFYLYVLKDWDEDETRGGRSRALGGLSRAAREVVRALFEEVSRGAEKYVHKYVA